MLFRSLVKYLEDHKDNLSEDSLKRLENNPLRILDSKNKNDIEILVNAPKLSEYRSDESKDNYEKIINMITDAKISYKENPLLVRGLDYYNDFTFEIVPNESTGSQNALGGGGQYDRLSSLLGGKEINGFGVAFGIDRIMDL